MRLIDKDALLQSLGITDMDCDKCDWGLHHKCSRGGDFEDACCAIEDAPTVEPERKWIPCSERLPENGRQVLVFARSVHFALAKYDEMREADGTYKKQWVTFDAWKPFYTIKNVIAWMPLPEPYQERREE